MAKHIELIALWHFDETDGPIAGSAVMGGRPLQVHGAVFERRRFGGALVLRRAYDYARGDALPALRAGTISFWLRLDARPQAVEVLGIHGTFSIMVDAGASTGLVANVGDAVLPSGRQIAPGHWHHVALTFSPDGANLYLDGEAAAQEPSATRGLTFGLNRDEYLTIGSAASQFTPFAIDELAIFSGCLGPDRVRQLAMGDLEQTAPARAKVHARSVNARDHIDGADPTCGLQRAIDAAGPAGGQVTIPAGRYLLRQPLRMSSGVTLQGEGGQVVLAACEPGVSPLASHCSEGATTVRVEDPAVFNVADQLLIRSDVKLNAAATQATIVAIEGNTLHLSRPLARDYMTFNGAVAVRWFPLIQATRHHRMNVRDICIEGHPTALDDINDPITLPCAAIHLLDCVDCGVSRCRITGWPHDGIGVHGGARIRVDDCTLLDCLGHGIRLDDEARLLQLQGNLSQRNRMDGLFIGEEIEDATVTGNTFTGNGGYGIGGLEHPNRSTILVSSNHCLHNRLGGIQLTGESETVINNLCTEPTKSKRLSRRMF